MNIRTTMKSLVDDLRTGVAQRGLGDRKDITRAILSRESMDDAAKVLSVESEAIHLTKAQHDSARMIAALAVDPVAGMKAIANPIEVSKPGMLSVESSSLGVTDSLDGSVLSTESFDGQSISNAMYFSIAYNLFAARQDELGETFYPTITIDPAMSGMTITTEVTSIYTNFQRSVTGAPDKQRFNKVTLAKAIYDNTLLGGDRNRVVPVSRNADAANQANLLPALEHVDTTTGTNVTTAPLAIGKSIGLLGISQTDAQLARGIMDAFDALDRTMNMQYVIVSLTKVIAANPAAVPPVVGSTVVEYFRVPVSMLPGSNFTYTTQGHDKDLQMTFDSTDVIFSTSGTVMYNGAASTILGALPTGHTVRMHVKLNGDGNTQHGDVAVYAAIHCCLGCIQYCCC